jgi:uncharacterized protein with HEPN domain
MRREALKRLHDALEAIEAIQRFIEDCTLDHYLENELIQSAVERKFEIIGEALNRAQDTDSSVLDFIPDLRLIVGTRNRIIHVYDTVDQADSLGCNPERPPVPESFPAGCAAH